MSAGPYSRAAGRGCRLLALQLVLVPIVFVVVFVVPIAIAAVIPGVADEVRLVIGGAGILLATTVLVVGALAFAGTRTRVLDAGFAPLGMRGGGWVPNLREYHGALGGRAIHALYARRNGLLDVSIDARSATKVAIGSAAIGAARETLGLTALPIRPDLPGALVSADDPAWADALLSDPRARDALAYLLHDPSGRELRWVLVRPDHVKVTRRWIDPDAAGAHIPDQARALAQLADACERMPPPARTLAPARWEGAFRRAPTRTAMLIVAAILAVLIGPVIAIGAIAIIASQLG